MSTIDGLYRRWRRRFGVSAVQGRTMIRAAAFFLIFVGAVTVLKSATNALFLSRRDPATLPYLYLATAAVVALVTVGLGHRLSTRSAKTVLVGTVWLASGIVAGLTVLAAAGFGGAFAALYVAGEVFATALSVLFWARLGEMFDVRIAKRVLGFISAAGMAGAVAGGLAVPVLAGTLDATVWCFAAAAAVAVARPLLGRGQVTSVQRPTIRFADGLRYAVKDGFPRGVALLVLLLAVQTATVDYVFRVGAAAAYGDEAALVRLFGALHAVVGVGALAVQGFGTGPLLRRFGVFAFLSIIPVLCMAAGAWTLARPEAFGALFLLKTFEMMGSLSLHQPALGILYNPMPTGIRDAVRAVVDGAVKKVGGAIGGLLLIAVGALLPARLLVGVVVLLAALLLWRIYRLRPRYLAALASKLAATDGRSLPVIDPSDRSTRQRLLTALEAPDSGTVLRALEILAPHRGSELALYLLRLLTHPHLSVRERAMALIEEAPHPRYAPILVRILEGDDDRPKGMAARALEVVDREAAARVLLPILDDPTTERDPGLIVAAVRVGLGGDPEPQRAAREAGRDGPGPADAAQSARRVLQVLLARGADAPVRLRRALAELLGQLGEGPTAAHLTALLADPHPSVRRRAALSAASARHPELPARLLPLLADPETRPSAERALVAHGDQAVPLLTELLVSSEAPVVARLRIPRLFRDIGTDAAAMSMLLATSLDEPQLRFAVIQALFELRARRRALALDPIQVEQAVLIGLAEYRTLAGVAADLVVGGPDFALLARAALARQEQSLQSVAMLLALVYDFEALARVVAGLRAGHVPDALELLEVALAGTELRKTVVKGLEVEMRTARPAAAAPRARDLLNSPDRTLALLAHRILQRLGHAPGPAPARLGSPGDFKMSDSLIDRVFILESAQLFQGLPVDVLTRVATLSEEGRAEPYETIYSEGQPGDALYVIVAGEVWLIKDEQALLALQPGDSFGQVSLLDGGTRPVSAQAREAGADYLVLPRGPFMDLVSEDPTLVPGMFTVLARRLRELVDLTAGSAPRSASTPRSHPRTSTLPVTVRSSSSNQPP